MAYALLGFGGFAVYICHHVLLHHDKYWISEAIAVLSVPIILTTCLFIMVTNQAPEVSKELIGFLGAVVGYVFGLVTPRRTA